MQLFSRESVGVIMDAGALGTEKRKKYEEDKVFKVTLRIPLTPALASDLVPGDGQIKAAMYAAAIAGDVRPFLRETTWNMVVPPQRLEVRATPDSPVTMIFDHVKISKVFKVKVRGTECDLQVRIVVGGVGPQEREALAAWHRSEKWVSFYEADSTLNLAGDVMTEADEKARAPHLAPMFEDERDLPGVPPSSPLAVGAGQTGKTLVTGGWSTDVDDPDFPERVVGISSKAEREAEERAAGHRYPDTTKKRKQRRDAKAAERVGTTATPDEDEQPDQVM